MSETTRHRCGIGSTLDQLGRVSVSEIMKPDDRKLGSFGMTTESPSEHIRPKI
jgi:hypothetical protein